MATYADVFLAQFDTLAESVAEFRVAKNNFPELLDGALVLGMLSEFVLELAHISAAGARAGCIARVLDAFPKGKLDLERVAMKIARGATDQLSVPAKKEIIIP